MAQIDFVSGMHNQYINKRRRSDMEILRIVIIVLAVGGILFGLYKLLIGVPREAKREMDKIDKEDK